MSDAAFDIIDTVGELNEDALVLDDLDCCIIGWGTIANGDALLLYDYDMMVAHFMGVDGMDLDGARDWVDYNICNILDDNAPFICRQGDTLQLPDAHMSEYHSGEQLGDVQAVRDE